MRNTALLALVGLFGMACASAQAPRPGSTTSPATLAPSGPAAQADAEQFRRELEETHEQILARTGGVPGEGSRVDLEAATSIPIPQHRTVDAAVRLFSGDLKEKIQRSMLRSGRYRDLIDAELERQKLPKALAYLPVIESAFVPTLTSRAGAHGLWQFMPATAREYGLRVDWWIDERADPELSTRAAATFLKDLHRMFGDWSLALAAYNCGPGRVRRTMESSGAKTFWELIEQGLLPKETRGYVPTFYATLIIAGDPAAYGFRLGERIAPAEKNVEIRGPVSLAYVAEVIGVTEDLLQDMNPSLHRGVVPPGLGSVRVPAHAASQLASRAGNLWQEDSYLRFAEFKVRNGDSIQRLARAVGTDAETIAAMNNRKSSSTLRAGEAIYLPVRAREVGALLAHSQNHEIYYSVQKGDTLYSIAKRNNVSVAELREMNELPADSILSIGQKLRISAPRTFSAGGM
jgi:membrane-bound lytic murein transglycosylase D